MKIKEVDILNILKEYLIINDYIVYCEVPEKASSKRMDIFAIKDDITYVFEGKLNPNLEMFKQIFYFKKHANYNYVVLPKYPQKYIQELLKAVGIGLVIIRYNEVIFHIESTKNEKIILPFLHETMKTQIPGSNRSKFITPFKNTIMKMEEILGNDEMELEELLKISGHHYSNIKSAKNAIYNLVIKNKIKNFSIRKEKRKILIKNGKKI